MKAQTEWAPLKLTNTGNTWVRFDANVDGMTFVVYTVTKAAYPSNLTTVSLSSVSTSFN